LKEQNQKEKDRHKRSVHDAVDSYMVSQ